MSTSEEDLEKMFDRRAQALNYAWARALPDHLLLRWHRWISSEVRRRKLDTTKKEKPSD
jgi:hypothetical protein